MDDAPKQRGAVVSSFPLFCEESVIQLGKALALAESRNANDVAPTVGRPQTWDRSLRYLDSSEEEVSSQSSEEDAQDFCDKGEDLLEHVPNGALEEEARDTFDTEALLAFPGKHTKPQPTKTKKNGDEHSAASIRKHVDSLSCVDFDLPEDDVARGPVVIELPTCLLSKDELLYDNLMLQCKAYHDLSVAVSLKERPVIVFFVRSGRFAGAVFVQGSCLRHRTSVRYTVRKGQGKAQSAQDGSQRRAISMGAQLRRQGEVQLRDDIRTTVLEWKEDILHAALILVSIPRTMQKDLFENNLNILSRTDPRIRRIPLDLGRPTHENACLIHSVLLTVTVRERLAPVSSFPAELGLPKIPEKSVTNYSEEAALSIIDNEPALEIVPLSNLHLAAQKGDVDALNSILDSSGDDIILNVINLPAGPLSMTPLHYAAEAGSDSLVDPVMAATCVRILLERGHADPCCTDSRRRVPYFLALNDRVRDAFRIARSVLGEEYCHWEERAKVGPALTEVALDEKAEKEAEKRRKKRAKQKEKKARDKAEEKAAEERRIAVEEKAKLEEEARRIRHGLQPKTGSGGSCDFCQTVCVGRKRANMFKRMDYSYCSSECLQKHKRELMATAALARLGK